MNLPPSLSRYTSLYLLSLPSMARQGNSFALLDDEEGDDVSTIIARVAAKVEASTTPPQSPPAAPNFPQKPLSTGDYVRSQRGRGRGGQGRGSGRYSGNDVKQSENGQPNGYQRYDRQVDDYRRDNGRANGYRRDNGWSDGYRQDNGRRDGYQQNYGGNSAGYAVDDSWQEQGRGRWRGGGGRRGRGSNEDNGSVNEGQVFEGNQLESQGQDGDSGGSQEKLAGVRASREKRQLRNENWSSHGERRGNDGGYQGSRTQEGRSRSSGEHGEHDGRYNGRGEVIKNSETKEVLSGNGEHTITSDNNITEDEGNVAVIIDHSKDKAGEEEIEENKITLKEYEKLLLEKRKTLEALKTEERKVTLDKDFEVMQLVEKKKEGSIFIKLAENDKLKKKDSLDKDEKVRKSVNINEFLKPAEGAYHGRHGGRSRGHGEQGGYRGGYSRSLVTVVDVPTPAINDPSQFPVLGGPMKE